MIGCLFVLAFNVSSCSCCVLFVVPALFVVCVCLVFVFEYFVLRVF